MSESIFNYNNAFEAIKPFKIGLFTLPHAYMNYRHAA
jgi:hypothetical protein